MENPAAGLVEHLRRQSAAGVPVSTFALFRPETGAEAIHRILKQFADTLEPVMAINDDEFQDANRILKDHGHELFDFEIRDIQTPNKPGLFPPTQAITVRRKSNKVERRYSPGNWVIDFEKDLATGEFGGP